MTSSNAHAMTSGISWRQRVEVCARMLSIPLAARRRGLPVEPIDARESVETREYAIHETVAVAIPQRVGVQRAAEARLLVMQSLAAFVHADPLVDAVPHVLQPAHMVEVVAARRSMVHAEKLVEQASGIAQYQVEGKQPFALAVGHAIRAAGHFAQHVDEIRGCQFLERKLRARECLAIQALHVVGDAVEIRAPFDPQVFAGAVLAAQVLAGGGAERIEIAVEVAPTDVERGARQARQRAQAVARARSEER